MGLLVTMVMLLMLVIKLIIMLMVMMDCGEERTNQLDYLESLIGRHQAGSQIHQEERVVLEEHNTFSKMPLIEMGLTLNQLSCNNHLRNCETLLTGHQSSQLLQKVCSCSLFLPEKNLCPFKKVSSIIPSKLMRLHSAVF